MNDRSEWKIITPPRHTRGQGGLAVMLCERTTQVVTNVYVEDGRSWTPVKTSRVEWAVAVSSAPMNWKLSQAEEFTILDTTDGKSAVTAWSARLIELDGVEANHEHAWGLNEARTHRLCRGCTARELVNA